VRTVNTVNIPTDISIETAMKLRRPIRFAM